MTLTTESWLYTSLEVRLFGGFDVRVDERSSPHPCASRREQWLLALLVLRQDRDTARDWLAAALWPDNDEIAGPLLSAQKPFQSAAGAGAGSRAPAVSCSANRAPGYDRRVRGCHSPSTAP